VNDFIEFYPNLLDAGQCRQIIARFEASPARQPGRVGSGVDRKLKDSRDLTISQHPEWRDIEELLNQAMMRALCAYLRRYPQTLISPLALGWHDPDTGEERLLRADDFPGLHEQQLAAFARYVFRPGSINVQGYTANEGGYPYWHCEQYPRDAQCEALHRVLLWTLYLNDDFADGETEFLLQQRKVKPQTGAMVIAPAAFTHTHRGNRPLDGDKYIATSWILFRRAEQLFPSG
jgi:hypothetical protein